MIIRMNEKQTRLNINKYDQLINEQIIINHFPSLY